MMPICRLALIAALGVAMPLSAAATLKFPFTFRVDCDTQSYWTITKALQFARDGDTIKVSGSCTETVVLDKGVTLDGGGTASLSPELPTDPTISITAKNAVVRGFSLESPALFQVFMLANSSAHVDGNVIRNAQNFGVSLATLAQLVLTDNVIADNGLGGMVVLAQSQVTVGAELFFGPFLPNTFRNNGPFGMVVADGSGAVVIGPNVFTGNHIGIGVVVGAQARIAGNIVDGNNIGIFVDSGANVQLATQGNAVEMFNEPNTGSNAQLGIGCKGGSIQGLADLAPAVALPPTPGQLIGSNLGLATYCLDQTEALPSP